MAESPPMMDVQLNSWLLFNVRPSSPSSSPSRRPGVLVAYEELLAAARPASAAAGAPGISQQWQERRVTLLLGRRPA
jgi:hypothetical protein